MYLKSNIIRKIYLYSNQEVILGEMDIFISQNKDNSDLMKDVSKDVSLDPLVLISNLKKSLKKKRSLGNTIIDHNMYQLKQENTVMFYKFHFHWEIYLVLKNRMWSL